MSMPAIRTDAEAGPAVARAGKGLARQTAGVMLVWGGSYTLKLAGAFALTKLFSVAEFGVYGISTALVMLLGPIVGMTLWTFLNRAGAGQELAQRLGCFKVTLLGETLLSVAFVIALIYGGPLDIFARRLHLEPYRGALVATLWLIAAGNVNNELTTYLAAKLEIIRSNVTSQLGQALPVLPLLALWILRQPASVALVVWLGVGGMVAANLYGCTRVEWRSWLRLPMDRRLIRQAGLYSAPLIFSNLNYGLLRFFDRFILTTSRDLHTVGIYTFAFMLVGLLYTFAWRVLINSFGAHIIGAHNQGDVATRDLCLTYLLKIGLAMFLGFTLAFMLIGKWLVVLVGRPEYLASVPWVAWIALAHLLIIASVPADLLLQLENRTRAIAVIEVAAAISTVSLDLALIPPMGIAGAVLASCCGWAVVLSGKMLLARSWLVIRPRELFSVTREVQYCTRWLGWRPAA